MLILKWGEAYINVETPRLSLFGINGVFQTLECPCFGLPCFGMPHLENPLEISFGTFQVLHFLECPYFLIRDLFWNAPISECPW